MHGSTRRGRSQETAILGLKWILLLSLFLLSRVSGFYQLETLSIRRHSRHRHGHRTPLLCAWKKERNTNRKSDEEEEEEARLKILEARRKNIRSTLKAAESLRNFRLQRGFVPELDPETGKPIKSDGKVALTLTAFVVAAGAIALRIGGRAALVSAVGLDFVQDSPELKENLDKVLTTAETMDPIQKLVLFTAAWTAVKVLCVDAGGIVLALASGILFGGVLQGAVASAGAATVGSCAAFGLAKLDTPVRKKALELLDEYPSLRGIEKVVARDGLKAILTLRLAPVLPIPIGMYNYVYGVTNVPLLDFCSGIFLGSLKPYLLDSYLGYFGKEVVQGTTDATGLQDVLLLAALGVSVLIGVFASQLAGDTWDSVLEEVEAEKKASKSEQEEDDEAEKDGITREIFGWELPEWVVGFQLSLQQADARIREMILTEYEAKVWNETDIPEEMNPENFADSPEISEAWKGIDLAASICDGLVLSPLLFESFLKYADPLYDEAEDESLRDRPAKRVVHAKTEQSRQELLERLGELKRKATNRITLLDEMLRNDTE